MSTRRAADEPQTPWLEPENLRAVAYEVQSSILRLSIVRKSETFLVSNVA
jgi:hypothetical protein